MSDRDEFPPFQLQPYDATRPPSEPPKKKKKKRRLGCLVAQFGCLFIGVAVAVALGVAVVLALVFMGDLTRQLEEGLARLEAYDSDQMFQTTRIYDRHGNLLHEIYEEGRRTLVTLDQIPQDLIDASIATEDDSFWDNPGVDMQSILRAALQWIQEGDIVSGASTITQQVVRQVAFEYEERIEQSMQRKMKEAILAMLLNERKSKSEILELYLNLNNYGNQAYGVEAAAQLYFGKPAAELNLAQAALLAGLPQAPGELDPLSPDEDVRHAVKDRQRTVLNLMAFHGYLTDEEADAAYREPLVLMDPRVPLEAPHFTLYAEEQLAALLERIGQDPARIRTGGLEVFTTVDLRYQRVVEKVASDHVDALRDAHNMTNAAAVAIHSPTGEILAMVGSIDYHDQTIDGQVNVTLRARQPGSALKPLTYATALEQGFTPAVLLWDTPTQIGTGEGIYIPVNYDRSFHGPVRMREALANSYNVPAVQMLRQVGVGNLLVVARRFGIGSLDQDASYYGLSLTLGGGGVTPLELTQAYTVFANGGDLVPTVAVLCVLDSEKNILYQYEDRCLRGQGTPQTVNAVTQRYPVLDPRIAFIISDILGDNAARTPAMGADSALNTGAIPASAKTGTSNDFHDNWTVGYTRNLAVGVWAGNNDNSEMINISGLQGAAPIWRDVMLGIYNNPDLLAVMAHGGELMTDHRSPPSGLTRREVCVADSLQDPATECPRTYVEWFLDGPAAVPDGQGNLAAPPASPTSPPPENPTDPLMMEVDEHIWVASVLALPPELQTAVAPAATDSATMPPPLYCIAPRRWDEMPEASQHLRQLWFVEGPPVRDDEIRARQWARERGIPVLPFILCDDSFLDYFNAPQLEGLDASYRITSPRPGEQVSGVVPIVGTVQFNTEDFAFYKMVVGRPAPPDQWRDVTFGETHSEPVVNDVLEYLHSDALAPGPWVVCLELVDHTGNFPPPYCVQVEVVR